jgi:hypothetical protein
VIPLSNYISFTHIHTILYPPRNLPLSSRTQIKNKFIIENPNLERKQCRVRRGSLINMGRKRANRSISKSNTDITSIPKESKTSQEEEAPSANTPKNEDGGDSSSQYPYRCSL